MHVLRVTILTAIILSAAYAVGQDAASSSTKPNVPSDGDTAYSNECLALAYRPPDGWKFAQTKANHHNQQMVLFKVRSRSAAGSAESLELDALQTPLEHPNMERFTILLALSLVHVNAAENKITRDAYPVTIANRSFYRSDLRVGDKPISVFTTWYRKYAIVAWANADSLEDIEDAANALRALSFGEDKRTADCFASAK